jgi:tellurite methyltransferase
MSAADRQKWNAKYADGHFAPQQPSAVLVGLGHLLPPSGSALDVAGGGGRHAIWLAQRGFDVTLADISSAGLATARQRAAAAGVSINTVEVDLEQKTLPAGPFDLIASVCYLCRSLFPQLKQSLAAGGTLIVIQPTTKNLERNDKPPAPYLFGEGELRTLASGLDIVHYAENWSADNRHDAVLVARKQVSS